MGKIVVAIPYYESDPGKRDVLSKCLSSLKGHDETLVLAGKQKTLPLAWNMCLDLAFDMGADHVVLSNDDIVLDKGTLDMLCRKGEVVSPTVNNGIFKTFHAHIFALPKSVYEKVGKFDERFKIYWADTDYAKRLKEAGIPVSINPEVNVQHPEAARTLKSFKGEFDQRDEREIYKKWGRTWFDPITGT